MMKTSLIVAFVALSMVLLIPGCNGNWDPKLFIPEAQEGLNQKWQTKMSNNRMSKTTHDTESSNIHHTGQQTWPGYRDDNNRY